MAPRLATASAVATVLAAAAGSAFADPRVESHSIEVNLDPATSKIEATDRLAVVRDAGGPLFLTLNSGLTVAEAKVDGVPIAKLARVGDDGWKSRWRVDVPEAGGATARVEFRYAGTIADQVQKSETLSFVVGDGTRGVICPDGVYLSEGSGWYPDDGGMARYDVKATIPEPYLVVTQGTHSARTGVWAGKYDTDGVSLVAGKWKHEEKRAASGVTIGTYLSETNAASAKLLLDATEGYLRKYSELLGPYAYDRFDIVENWFTTGYGMPEFTLLGRDVIARMVGESARTGAIPGGYLDHEIVHSWWGNLVFPDYASGNWCEGLTSYCANYFAKEAESPAEAREYRRRTIVRFTIRATPERDYPVRNFRGKTEDVDDDIGYGKCSMLFHALRRDIGDEVFWETLPRVARENRGRRFSWGDWQSAFETTSKRNLGDFFKQGLDRRGAPLFAIRQTAVSADGGRLRVSGTVAQVLGKDEPAWRVTVPLVIEHLGGREELLIDCAASDTHFSVLVPSLPLRVTVDPDFHTFRRLADDEVAPCLAATLQQGQKLVVYPDGDEALKAAAEMAAARSGGQAVVASEVSAKPSAGTSYIVFGDAARVPLLATLAATLPSHFPSSRATETTTVLATARSPADPTQFVTTFTGAPAAVAKRARAIFYYQYDGRIVFDGPVPKDRSQVAAPNHASRTLLPDVKASASPESVRALVDRLAAPEMNGRLAGGPEEKKVRAMIAEEFTLAGLAVDEEAFAFTVKSMGAKRSGLVVSNPGSLEVIHPPRVLVASPGTPGGGVAVNGVSAEAEDDLTGRAFLIDLPAEHEDYLGLLRSTADLVKQKGAVALIVRTPAEPSRAMRELEEFPGETVPAYRAAGTAARTGSTRELSLPAIVVGPKFDPAQMQTGSIAAGFQIDEVRTSNVIARVKAAGKSRRPGVVVLGAHYDHLGAGFPGGDDNASGIAALTEAARVLSAHSDLLGRDVVLVAFGAEEWGLRGSKAFVETWPKDEPIVAMINADSVGRRGIGDVSVVGQSKYPRLAQVVSAALEQANLVVGKDIDRHAFAWGSDHWSFHEAGVPAVDLWSGDYGVMHTERDTADGVDEAKVSRVGRAMALAALAVAGGF